MALRSVKLLTVREKSLRCVNCMSLSTLKIFFGLAGKVVEGSNVFFGLLELITFLEGFSGFTVRTVRTVRKLHVIIDTIFFGLLVTFLEWFKGFTVRKLHVIVDTIFFGLLVTFLEGFKGLTVRTVRTVRKVNFDI